VHDVKAVALAGCGVAVTAATATVNATAVVRSALRHTGRFAVLEGRLSIIF